MNIHNFQQLYRLKYSWYTWHFRIYLAWRRQVMVTDMLLSFHFDTSGNGWDGTYDPFKVT